MPFVRSLDNAQPPARFDGTPFTQALIQESASSSGPWTTVDTKPLTPVDTDPAHPAERDFTTALATLETGYYRIVWEDAAGAAFTGDSVFYSPAAEAAGGSWPSADLTTVPAVRAYLQKPASDTSQDPLIASLISNVSALMERYAAREFTPTASAARVFAYKGGGLLELAPYDLRMVTAVTYDAESAAPVTIAADRYRLRPVPSTTGTFQQLYLEDYRRWLRSPVVVEVSGAWGFSTVPSDVQHAANMAVAHALRNEVGITSTITELGEVRFERPAALPATVRAVLDQYRVLVVA